MIEAVVFDMDGLMFDTERLSMEGWRYIARITGKPITDEVIISAFGADTDSSRRLFKGALGEDFDFDGYRVQKWHYMQAHMRENGVPVKKGLRELLQYLRQSGFRIAVATSTARDRTTFNLQSTGIEDFFDAVITGDMIEHGKPAPDIYLTACRALGVEPASAMALEDSLAGIASAHSAGMKCVMIPDVLMPDEKTEAMLYARFESLDQVIDLLKKERTGQNG